MSYHKDNNTRPCWWISMADRETELENLICLYSVGRVWCFIHSAWCTGISWACIMCTGRCVFLMQHFPSVWKYLHHCGSNGPHPVLWRNWEHLIGRKQDEFTTSNRLSSNEMASLSASGCCACAMAQQAHRRICKVFLIWGCCTWSVF